MDKFWTQDTTILFKHSKILEIWPYKSMSYEQQLNATTRFIIITSLIGYMLLNNYVVVLLGLVLISLIVLLYKFNKNSQKEGMASCSRPEIDPTLKNPFQNVMMTDYIDNPQKAPISAKYDENVEKKVNDTVKSMIMENNSDNKDISKIFSNLSDTMQFEQSLRQFNVNPSTSIPNTQDDFLKYCYNDLYSEKPLTIY